MTTRKPNPRYLRDGLYIRHDGAQFVLETSDGITVKSRIGMDETQLDAVNSYREYVTEFYGNGQHQVTPNCEECGTQLEYEGSTIRNAVRGEVYQLTVEGEMHEVRLCPNCSTGVTEERLRNLIGRRSLDRAERDQST